MDTLLDPRFSWLSFGIIAFILVIAYLSIQFLLALFRQMDSINQYRKYFIQFAQDIILLYEPLAILILMAVFVFISPVVHVLLLLGLWLIGFRYMRDYVCGRILRFESNLQVATRLQTPHTKGAISKIGRLGLSLKTERGLQFINYSELYRLGFTALASKGIGGVYELALSPMENTTILTKTRLENLLVNTPYIDSKPTPEVVPQAQAGHYDLRVQLREESHLHDFMQLLQEWGIKGVIKK